MWCLSTGSCLLTNLRSFISSRLWSKKSLLFLIILTQTSIPVCRSCAWIALLNAADPKYSVTWYRPAITEFSSTLKFLSSSKPVIEEKSVKLDQTYLTTQNATKEEEIQILGVIQTCHPISSLSKVLKTQLPSVSLSDIDSMIITGTKTKTKKIGEYFTKLTYLRTVDYFSKNKIFPNSTTDFHLL